MIDELYLLVSISTGRVLNVVVGEPSDSDGLDVVPVGDGLADVRIGWTRSADGTFSPPVSAGAYPGLVGGSQS